MSQKRLWAPAEHLFLVQNYGFLSFPEIARRLGRNVAACRRRYYASAEAAQLGRTNRPKFDPVLLPLSLHDALLRRHGQGANDPELAEEFDLQDRQVRCWRRYHALPPNIYRDSPRWMLQRRQQVEKLCRQNEVASLAELQQQRQKVGSLLRGCAVPLSAAEEKVAQHLHARGPLTVYELAADLGYSVRPGQYGNCLRQTLAALKKKGLVLRRSWQKTGPGKNQRTPRYALVAGAFTDDPEYIRKRDSAAKTAWKSDADLQKLAQKLDGLEGDLTI